MKQAIPRVNIFLHLWTDTTSSPLSFKLSSVSFVIGATMMFLSSM